MIEFLQTYGIWIVIGALFLLMVFGKGGCGMGCGMGSYKHDQKTGPGEENKDGKHVEKHGSGCH
jgi:hypothetical protein